jgi:hypothetical protein
MMLPCAELRLLCAMVNPPKPLGFDIVVDGAVVATLDLEEFKRAVLRLKELEAQRSAR